MQTAQKPQLTAREYLEQERKAKSRSEFLDGEAFPMSGGNARHSSIVMSLIGALHHQLKGKAYVVLDCSMRIKVEATGLYTYPDVQVVSLESRFEDEQHDVLLNPKIIIEVLSESTAAWDLGNKFWHYRHLESLAEYVLVYHEDWFVEHYLRQPDGSWRLDSIEGRRGVLSLPAVKCKVPLAEIYANTGLDPGARLTKRAPKPNPK